MELSEYELLKIRFVAMKLGYAIGKHGSWKRDFDLIAVPWVESVSDKDKLAEEIAQAVDGFITDKSGEWTKKPHGRESIVIMLGGGRTYIDLSVIGVSNGMATRLPSKRSKKT